MVFKSKNIDRKCNIRVGSIEFFKEKLEKVFDYIGLNHV